MGCEHRVTQQNIHEIAPNRIKQTVREPWKERSTNPWNYPSIKQRRCSSRF